MIYLYWSRPARGRRRGPHGVLQARRRHPGRRAAAAAAGDAAQRPAEPGLECAPFLVATRPRRARVSVFDNGLPLGATDWIRDGVLTELMRTRAYAPN